MLPMVAKQRVNLLKYTALIDSEIVKMKTIIVTFLLGGLLWLIPTIAIYAVQLDFLLFR